MRLATLTPDGTACRPYPASPSVPGAVGALPWSAVMMRRSSGAAAVVEQDAAEIERRGLQEFEAALGLTPPPDLPCRPVQIARFRDIDRWSHEGILYRSVVAARGASTERFPLIALGDVVAELETGWIPQCLDRPARSDEWGVLKLGAVSFGAFDESATKALPGSFSPKPEFEVKTGDVLISRGNVPALVGIATFVHETRSRLMFPDLVFRVIWAKGATVEPAFIAEVLRSPSLRQQIEQIATGTSPTMRKVTKPALLELTFPLPQGADGLATQNRLVTNLTQSRTAAVRRREEAKTLRTAAWDAFLAAVFS